MVLSLAISFKLLLFVCILCSWHVWQIVCEEMTSRLHRIPSIKLGVKNLLQLCRTLTFSCQKTHPTQRKLLLDKAMRMPLHHWWHNSFATCIFTWPQSPLFITPDRSNPSWFVVTTTINTTGSCVPFSVATWSNWRKLWTSENMSASWAPPSSRPSCTGMYRLHQVTGFGLTSREPTIWPVKKRNEQIQKICMYIHTSEAFWSYSTLQYYFILFPVPNASLASISSFASCRLRVPWPPKYWTRPETTACDVLAMCLKELESKKE